MRSHDITIHPSATVHPKARLDSGVWIGPGCVIGEKVSLGRNTRLESNVSIIGLTEVGSDCRFAPFSSIGTEPQDTGYKDDETVVRIGDGNIFKEFITVHRGTVKGGGVTRIGDRSEPVPDDVWDEAARHYDEQALGALVIAIANINLWNRLNVATRQVARPYEL